MFIQLTTLFCASQLITEQCNCLTFIDLPSDSDDPETNPLKTFQMPLEPIIDNTDAFNQTLLSVQSTEGYNNSSTSNQTMDSDKRRFIRPSKSAPKSLADLVSHPRSELDDEATEKYLKQKISTLIGQTIHDTTKKVKSVQKIKDRKRDEAPYKAGFILSMVRKSRLMLNDLFNLAVKHRDNWKALQQLKVFEYIVHTNVDTTNLVRQLVEIHIQHLNSTTTSEKKRVVLL